MKIKLCAIIFILMMLLSGCGRILTDSVVTSKDKVEDKDEPALSKEDKQFMSDLVGSWHSSPSVGSGFTERYIFKKGGEFEFLPSEYDDANGFSGHWEVDNGKLILNYEANGEEDSDKLSLGDFEEESPDASPYSIKLKIGGQYFWKYSDDPDLWAE